MQQALKNEKPTKAQSKKEPGEILHEVITVCPDLWQELSDEEKLIWATDEKRLFRWLTSQYKKSTRPSIVCICGSTRFMKRIREVGRDLTYEGKIVVGPECVTSSEHEFEAAHPELKAMMDKLHLRKIDLADEVFIVNVDGYIGESTAREIEYAKKQGKTVRFLEDE